MTNSSGKGMTVLSAAASTLGRNSQLLVLCLLVTIALLQLMIVPWRRTEALNRALDGGSSSSSSSQRLQGTLESGAGLGHEAAPSGKSKGSNYENRRKNERIASPVQERRALDDAGALIRLSSAPYSLPENLIKLRWKKAAKSNRGEPIAEHINLLQLGQVDVQPLRDRIKSLQGPGEPPLLWTEEGQKTNAFFDGRKGNQMKFKPGVNDIKFIFSDNTGGEVFVFPWFETWKDVLVPLIESALGVGAVGHVKRLQLARMSPNAEIKVHTDTGEWVMTAHRIHIPIVTNPNVDFQMRSTTEREEWESIPIVEGHVFEINNAVKHRVSNEGPHERIHLLIDISEEPLEYHQLLPGQKCAYHELRNYGANACS